jgi:hypothetical protein
MGPELFWLIFYLVVTVLAKANNPPNKTIEDLIQTCWFSIPVISLLVFALWWIPSVEKNWLFLRVWVTGMLGAHFVLERAINASSWKGPGAGTGYLAGILFVIIFLVVGTIFVKIRFWK